MSTIVTCIAKSSNRYANVKSIKLSIDKKSCIQKAVISILHLTTLKVLLLWLQTSIEEQIKWRMIIDASEYNELYNKT